MNNSRVQSIIARPPSPDFAVSKHFRSLEMKEFYTIDSSRNLLKIGQKIVE